MIRNVKDHQNQLTYVPYNSNPRRGRFYSNHLHQTYNNRTKLRAERPSARLPVIGGILAAIGDGLGINRP